MLASGWLLLLLLLLLLLQLVFIFVGILVESFSFFCAKIDNDRKIGQLETQGIVEYENIGEHGTIVRLRI